MLCTQHFFLPDIELAIYQSRKNDCRVGQSEALAFKMIDLPVNAHEQKNDCLFFHLSFFYSEHVSLIIDMRFPLEKTNHYFHMNFLPLCTANSIIVVFRTIKKLEITSLPSLVLIEGKLSDDITFIIDMSPFALT